MSEKAAAEFKRGGLRVGDIMTKGVITGRADDTLPDIAKIMADKGISSLIIVNHEDKAVGIISSLDVVKAFGCRSEEQIKTTKASEVMTHPVYDVNAEMTLDKVANIMVIKNIHRVVVLSSDKSRKPVGILSATDIVKVVTRLK
ncbi:MAG: CBS domain-containing protein [Nitrospiraceae bacterium]|nr:CBS domain-containing protein [Nitrospiraceae bacterium]